MGISFLLQTEDSQTRGRGGEGWWREFAEGDTFQGYIFHRITI